MIYDKSFEFANKMKEDDINLKNTRDMLDFDLRMYSLRIKYKSFSGFIKAASDGTTISNTEVFKSYYWDKPEVEIKESLSLLASKCMKPKEYGNFRVRVLNETVPDKQE